MKEIKAVFFDIDGTLRSFNTKSIPESNMKCLKKLKEKGIKIFLATGRAPYNLGFVRDVVDIEFDGFVTLNGQYCFDNEGNVIYDNYLDKSDIERVLPYLEKNEIACDFTEIDRTYLNLKNDVVKKLEEELEGTQKFVVEKDYRRALNNKIYQLIVFVDENNEKQILEYMPNSKSARWISWFMDVMPKNGGKNIGISKVIDRYGIKQEEIMSFGDGGNDIDMLKYTKIGVAMGNAGEDVKEAADYITDTVDEEGIRKALEYFNVL